MVPTIKFFKTLSGLIICIPFLIQCSSSKIEVYDTWKADANVIETFKSKNVLVIARTANDNARIAFEEEIAKQLRAMGVKCTESFMKVPKIHPNVEMSEKRLALIKSLLDSEGFTGIVLTSIKDKQKTVSTHTSGVRVGFYGNYYPDYYGNFYDYYAYPYAYGNYYNSFEGYIPTSTSTSVSTTYVLETIAYSLDESPEKQLAAVVTTSVRDPRKASEIAKAYVEKIMSKME
ncbi:MAG: hypothetical protein AB3N16_02395 [Flavobacteriaceae bacterium]